MRIRTPTELGQLARQRRLDLGITQAVLAARVGVSRKWIVDLEAGKPAAELALVLRALNVLGCQLDLTAPADTDTHSVIDDVVNASRRP